MKKNTFTVLFSKFGVALFFLMFLLWNEGQAQSYVSPEIAKTRLTEQADAWHRQAKYNPNQGNPAQLLLKSSIYRKMIAHLDEGATVAVAIDASVERFVTVSKASEPNAASNIFVESEAFRQSTSALLTN